jgi:proline dehydrogenase
MLYGVRTELQKQLHAQGEQVRLYLPFGRDWCLTPSAASAKARATPRCWRALVSG